jgi:hypothetical protein
MGSGDNSRRGGTTPEGEGGSSQAGSKKQDVRSAKRATRVRHDLMEELPPHTITREEYYRNR